MHFANRLAVAAVLLSLSAGCNAGAGKTPEATFETIKAAAAKEDWPTIVRCMTPRSRDDLAAMFAIGMAMSNNDEFASVLDKHGIQAGRYGEIAKDDSIEIVIEFDEKLLEPVTDRAEFIVDALAATSNDARRHNPKAELGYFRYTALTNVQIDGDSATGTHEFEWQGEKATAKLAFQKIGGRWFMDVR